MNSNSYQKILRLAGRYPNGPKKILKNAYGVYKEGWSTYQYFRYNNRYEYPIIYIAAGNRSGSTWLRNVLAFLLDGFIVYHPKNHPRADKGGNYDINHELIRQEIKLIPNRNRRE